MRDAAEVNDLSGPFAYTVLAAIVPFTAFAFLRRKPLDAALLVFLGSLLFGPMLTNFKLPLLPPFNKEGFSLLCILVALLVSHRQILRSALANPAADTLPLLAMVGCVATAFANTDPMAAGFWEVTQLPGMNFKDGVSMAADSALFCALPFFLGRALVRTADDVHRVLRALAMGGLVYAPFALFEIRMSPRLHVDVYGYFAHEDFSQTIRMGGFRPMVFMAHGLACALFFTVATFAMATLRRNERIARLRASVGSFVLAGVLLLCKSLATIFYLLTLFPVAFFARPRWRLRIAALMALFVLVYPVLRSYDLFPVDRVLEAARVLGEDRAGSLMTRFHNEEIVLAHARERLLLGWGSYGRHLVFDPDMGNVVVITDGAWIIQVGMQGVVGFLTQFGTLLLPIFLAWKRFFRIPPTMRQDVGGLALIVAITAFDLVPNGLFSCYPYFLAGALISAVGPVALREWARSPARTA